MLISKLTILLPFHIDNQFLKYAIASCASAMDEDSELILINTSGIKYRRHSNFQIIDAPGHNYIEALSIGLNIFSIPTIQLGDIVTVNYKNKDDLDLVTSDDTRFVVYNIEYSRNDSGPNMSIYLSEV